MTRINVVWNLETPEELEELAKAMKVTLTFQETIRRQKELNEIKSRIKRLKKEVDELEWKRSEFRKDMGMDVETRPMEDKKSEAEDEANEDNEWVQHDVGSPSEEALTTPEATYEPEASDEQDHPEREESGNR